ncbi:MAG: glycosyltransferase family 2 protein, partial [Actinobacteria bacterium]|nr:glycosyltransferase family 2 protein [Actinomycetota bacterium]
ESNIGLPASLNRAIRHSHAPYIVRVDSDDYVNEHFLSVLYMFLASNRRVPQERQTRSSLGCVTRTLLLHAAANCWRAESRPRSCPRRRRGTLLKRGRTCLNSLPHTGEISPRRFPVRARDWKPRSRYRCS